MTAELVKKWLISGLISGKLAIWTGSCIRKSIILMFLSSSRDKLSFCSKTQWQMFLLVSGRHVGASHTNLYKFGWLLRIAREFKTAETWFLVRWFILQSSIISQILEFIYWTVTIFSFDHMTDENRESVVSFFVLLQSIRPKVQNFAPCQSLQPTTSSKQYFEACQRIFTYHHDNGKTVRLGSDEHSLRRVY